MKIAVLVSGGVDSSLALRLLKEEGHPLTAFYLKIWLEDELAFLGECPWEDDLEYVRAVCEQANVPLEIVPFQKEYREQIVAYTIAEARAGRTPNPDMLCNARIKFGAFYDCVGGAYDKIATGHYAQVGEEPNDLKYFLKMSPDPIKDQTYFLSQLTQSQLARALFPIGQYQKTQVRKLAKKFALPNAERKESQGLCFLGKIPFDKFLEHHLGKRAGKLVEYESGKILGEHNGFWYFTVGQRRGIHLSGGPWYVAAKDIENNTIFISHSTRAPEKVCAEFVVSDCNWIAGGAPRKTDLRVKVRHGEKMSPAEIEYMDNNRLRVKLAEKDRGLAAGQFAVFYAGEYCLGGGMIEGV